MTIDKFKGSNELLIAYDYPKWLFKNDSPLLRNIVYYEGFLLENNIFQADVLENKPIIWPKKPCAPYGFPVIISWQKAVEVKKEYG